MFHVSSQGCPYGCGFCAIPAVGGRKWAAYDPDRVVADMLFLAEEHGVDGVTFGDTEFFVSEDRVRGIAEGLIAAGSPMTWWAMGTIARLVTYKEIDLGAPGAQPVRGHLRRRGVGLRRDA